MVLHFCGIPAFVVIRLQNSLSGLRLEVSAGERTPSNVEFLPPPRHGRGASLGSQRGHCKFESRESIYCQLSSLATASAWLLASKRRGGTTAIQRKSYMRLTFPRGPGANVRVSASRHRRARSTADGCDMKHTLPAHWLGDAKSIPERSSLMQRRGHRSTPGQAREQG